MPEKDALVALQASKKYGHINADTIARIFNEELQKRKSTKDAEKQTRARLHQMTGAFMLAQRKDDALLSRYQDGDEGALFELLRRHASTSERLSGIEALYAHVPLDGLILDLACGLNPIYLGHLGAQVRGYDLSGDAVAIVNSWAQANGWAVEAEVCDLLNRDHYPQAELALMMKLLPLIEQQRKGYGIELFARIPAKKKLVTFPTRTLGGRKVGMERHYSEWFESNLPAGHDIKARFVVSDELCYLVEVMDG